MKRFIPTGIDVRDAQLFRDTEPKHSASCASIQESMKLQFRAQVYNITNTEDFGQPNINITKWSATLPVLVNGSPLGRAHPARCRLSAPTRAGSARSPDRI